MFKGQMNQAKLDMMWGLKKNPGINNLQIYT